MTGADHRAVATRRRNVPEIASTGVISARTGAAADADGAIIVATPSGAAGLAAGMPGDDDPAVLLLTETVDDRLSAVPWSLVDTVVFPSDAAVREFTARSYDNFEPRDRQVLADPTLFSVLPLAFGTDEPLVLPLPELADRLIGAAACLADVPLPERAADARDSVVASLFETLSGGATGGVPPDRLQPLLTAQPVELIVLKAVLERLLDMDPGKPMGSRKLVSEIAEATAPSIDETSLRSLDLAIEVLKAKRELRPLRADHGLRSVKALLLFALRPEPADTIAWSSEMLDDPLTVALAAALSGIRAGWTRLPNILRGDARNRNILERHLADACLGSSSHRWTQGLPGLLGKIEHLELSFDRENSVLEHESDAGSVDSRSLASEEAADERSDVTRPEGPQETGPTGRRIRRLRHTPRFSVHRQVRHHEMVGESFEELALSRIGRLAVDVGSEDQLRSDVLDGEITWIEGPMIWRHGQFPDTYSAVVEDLWVNHRTRTMWVWHPWAGAYRPYGYRKLSISDGAVTAERSGGEDVFTFLPTDAELTSPSVAMTIEMNRAGGETATGPSEP